MGPKQYFHDGRPVSRRTYYRHKADSNDDTSSNDEAGPSNPPLTPPIVPSSSSPSSPASNTFPIVGGEDSPSSVERGNSPRAFLLASPPPSSDEVMQDVVDMWAGVGFVNGVIPSHALPQVDLTQTIENKVVSFQGLLDASNVPITVQSKILEQIFENKPKNQHEDSQKYDGLGLAQLIALAESSSVPYFSPSSWDKLEDFYANHGMLSPVRYRLCTGEEGNAHAPTLMEPSDEDVYEGARVVKCSCNESDKKRLQRDCPRCCEKCPICQKFRKLTLEFDYLPFGPRIAYMCESNTFCHELLEVWRGRQEWMHKSVDHKPPCISQFWHGLRMQELQDFWNPSTEWELPIHCSSPTCHCVFRAFPTKCVELLEGWDHDLQKYQIQCSCGTITKIAPSLVQGDPRNFAIAAHWDGFISATTKYKDSWAVEFELLNAGIKNVMRPMPVVFIPASSQKIVKDLDEGVLMVFLEPLMRELEAAFVHGFSVNYNYPPEIIDQSLLNPIGLKRLKLRAILMYWTGDHPAQCKVGGFKLSGYHACRRCHLKGKYVQGCGVVYPKNCYEVQYPHERQTIEDVLLEAKDVVTLASSSRSRREKNVTSFSKLWRLHYLYGFDLALDLVYDAMHILPLNLFKTFVEHLVQKGLAAELDIALRKITKFRPKQLGARWPSNIENRLSYWKAEEYQLFIMWCLPYCIDKICIPKTDRLYIIAKILLEIGRLFFSHTRTYGWTGESITTARTLLSAWPIQWEEYVGPSGSILHHVAGNGEMLDDVIRHGPHDLYWCYRFERSVSSYKSIKTNQKLSEVTYCKYKARVAYRAARESIAKDNDNLYPPQRAVVEIHKRLLTSNFRPGLRTATNVHACNESHKKGIIVAKSKLEALRLEKLGELLPPCHCKEFQSKGISVVWKEGNEVPMTNSIREYLRKYWTDEGLLNDGTLGHFHNDVEKVSSVIFRRTRYQVGDHVLARKNGTELNALNTLDHWTYKLKITMLFIYEFMGHHRMFFHGRFYSQIPKSNDNTAVELSDFSSMCLLHSGPRFYSGDDCRPIHLILHKFIEQSNPGTAEAIVAFEMADLKVRTHLIQLGAIGYCPPWPQMHDIMYCRRDLAAPHKAEICVVRGIILPQHLREDGSSETGTASGHDLYSGKVLMNKLFPTMNRDRGEYKASTTNTFQCSWASLVGHVLQSGIATCHTHGQPTLWQGIVLHDTYRRGVLRF